MIPIPEYIQTLSSSFSEQMGQPYLPHHFGAAYPGRLTETYQRIVLHGVAQLCLDQFPGRGLVEIGCAEGNTSRVLAEVAHSKGQTLTCVDPYNGQQEGTEAIYQQFLAQTAGLPNVRHIKASSLEPLGIQAICDACPALVFVDGLHYQWAAYRDIQSAYEALPPGGVVCVDDTNLLERDAGAAFAQALAQRLFTLVELPREVERRLYQYKSWHFGIRN